MANKAIRNQTGGAVTPAPTPTKAGLPGLARDAHAVLSKDDCGKCGGTGKLRFKDKRGVESVCVCQDCQPGKR